MNAHPQTRFILCADDYAMDPRVSAAMLDLADAGRLTAISAMTTYPLWADAAADLSSRRDRLSVGLHLDLTSRPFDGQREAYSLRALIGKALSGRIDIASLAAEFARQLNLFERGLGFPPDHIDGHHHVHALPGVRDALFKVLAIRFGDTLPHLRPWLRDPADRLRRIVARPGARSKAITVACLSSGFGRRAKREGYATNDGFSGFSRFRDRSTYAREFSFFALSPGRLPLVMCHPGRGGEGSPYEIGDARIAEYDFLSSDPHLPLQIMRLQREPDGAIVFLP